MQKKTIRSQTQDAIQQNYQYQQGITILKQPYQNGLRQKLINKQENKQQLLGLSLIISPDNQQNFSDAEIQYPKTGKQQFKKSIKNPKVQLPIIQNEIKQYYLQRANGNNSEFESKIPNIQIGPLNLDNQKMKKISLASQQQKSRSAQYKDENLQLLAFSEDEINSQNKIRNKRLKNIVKDLNKALSISPNLLSSQQTKNKGIINEDSESHSNLKLSEILKRNVFKLDIGKLVREKILEKRIENFQQLYGITNKYEDEEDDYSKKYTNNENNKVEDLRKRKRLILQVAQKKSPKFLYPLGPKIRVPNFSLENQYFFKSNIGASKNQILNLQQQKNYIDDDTNIFKLDSPPKNQIYPTSSMQEDYLDIKIQQIVRQI